jgi:hypothetical protein
MKENIFNLIPDSEDLVKRKSFNELSPAEKSQFLEYMTVEEYESIRQSLLIIKSAFKKEEEQFSSEDEIKNKLLAVFPSKERKTIRHFYDPVFHLLNVKIPAYQTVIIVIIAVILSFKISNTGSTENVSESKTDTVYIDRILNVPKSAESKFDADKENVQKNDIANIRTTKNKLIPNFNVETDKQNIILKQNLNILLNNINLVQNSKYGRTLENDKDIYKILVSAQ